MGGCNPIKSLRNALQQWGFNLRFVSKLRHIEPMLCLKIQDQSQAGDSTTRLNFRSESTIHRRRGREEVKDSSHSRRNKRHVSEKRWNQFLNTQKLYNIQMEKQQPNSKISIILISNILWPKSLQQGLIGEFSTLSKKILWKETIFSRNGSLGLFYFKSNFQTHHYSMNFGVIVSLS